MLSDQQLIDALMANTAPFEALASRFGIAREAWGIEDALFAAHWSNTLRMHYAVELAYTLTPRDWSAALARAILIEALVDRKPPPPVKLKELDLGDLDL